jgi:hypothetical protein
MLVARSGRRPGWRAAVWCVAGDRSLDYDAAVGRRGFRDCTPDGESLSSADRVATRVGEGEAGPSGHTRPASSIIPLAVFVQRRPMMKATTLRAASAETAASQARIRTGDGGSGTPDSIRRPGEATAGRRNRVRVGSFPPCRATRRPNESSPPADECRAAVVLLRRFRSDRTVAPDGSRRRLSHVTSGPSGRP